MAYKIKKMEIKHSGKYPEVQWNKKQEKRIFFRRIARKNGIWNSNLFEIFMMERFPNEASEGYVAEWAERFKSGDPTGYMDSTTLKAYIKAVQGKSKYKYE
jgi:hypothetical protein